MSQLAATVIADLRHIVLKPGAEPALYQQLYQQIRDAILAKRLLAGMRLPASRELAKALQVSRNTVQQSLEQLQAEGYLIAKPGAGVFIAATIPDSYHQAQQALSSSPLKSSVVPLGLSKFSQAMNEQPQSDGLSDHLFVPGVPALKAFPNNIWLKLWHQHLRAAHVKSIDASHGAGYFPLQQAISEYVGYSRAVNCVPEQVIITNGAQHGLDIICKLLLNRGDHVVVEDPGYLGIRAILQAMGARILSCPVDADGLKVGHLDQFKNKQPKFIYSTPNHQFPLGMLMSISRRLQLLDWAKQHDCYIIEDDYDSEFHYNARPLPSLQGMDHHQRVIYVGSFSKVLLPTLRLGYIIVPLDLVSVLTKVKQVSSGNIAYLPQAVTADFLQHGHFSRHLKRMRVLYEKRMYVLIEACSRQLSDVFDICIYGAGMHLVLVFKNNQDDQALVKTLKNHGIYCGALSAYYLSEEKQTGLVLGFANASESEVVAGIAVIADYVI